MTVAMQVSKPFAHKLAQEVDSMTTVVKQIGATRIVIHSPSGFIQMSTEEQRQWFTQQWENGDPVVRNIVETVCRIRSKRSNEIALKEGDKYKDSRGSGENAGVQQNG